MENFEYKGYSIMSNFLLKIYRIIDKFGNIFLKFSEKLRFEQYKMIFGERDEDIYIATYPKSGTTMMQMILYHLTSDGKMDFNHIYDLSPWIRNASFKKQAPIKLPSPRIIKTHDYHNEFPKGTKGRFIYVYRNGMDVAVSLYHQQKNYINSNLEFDKFLVNYFKKKAWFNHTKGWFKNNKNFPILYIKYEDLLQDKQKEIIKIIDFCKLTSSPEAIDRAIKYSSFEYMKIHEKKFGDQPQEHKKVYDQFIRKGKTGEGEEYFKQEQKDMFEKYYNKMVKSLENKIFGI